MAFVMGAQNSISATSGLAQTKSSITAADPVKIDVTRLPTEDIENAAPIDGVQSRTILHIYFEQDCGHQVITPVVSISQERRFGPKPKEQEARRAAKKAAKKLREASQAVATTIKTGDCDAFSGISEPPVPESGTSFLHTPYLSFHLPPSVLYVGTDRYAPSTPVALLHAGWFWRSYKIQLGPALSIPGVIDPRGVVSWRHNGGSKKVLQNDERNGLGKLLRGYKVRGWRLWGESGKRYVHDIRDRRKAKEEFDDPDIENRLGEEAMQDKACADDVAYLTWMRPLSKHTRLYTFNFRGIEFQWKGTGTVSERRKCGWLLRYCHLKLVAKVPIDAKTEEGDVAREVCLAKYTSSIAAEKTGTLELFDHAVLRLVDDVLPGLLEEKVWVEKQKDSRDDLEHDRVARLRRSTLYQLFVATVICMAKAEKEKRHTLIDLVIGIFENAGNGGG